MKIMGTHITILLRKVLVIVLLVSGSLTANAAVLEGSVTDMKTGETLLGATIRIEGTSIGSIADLRGNFRIVDIPLGNHTIVAGFLGYDDQEFEISITAHITFSHDFLLVASSTALGEIVISERATGQVKTMRDQREADNIMNIVSEDQIKSFPDLNAADALSRVPGVTLTRDQGEGKYVQLRGTPPELTNFNVNGIQLPSPESSIRTVGMDVINASQIQTIEVSKVLTPDMNGDAIGGTVNLKTKRAESTIPTFNVVLAGGYNNLRQTPNGEAQFTFSQRSGRVGFLINGNYIRSLQGADNMEFKYDKGVFFGGMGVDNYFLQYNEVQLRHYEVDRERQGLSGTFDFYIDEKNRLFINGMYNRFTDNETRRRKVFTLDDATSERNYLYGGIEHDLRDREKVQTISSISLGGEHDFRIAKLTYELARSQASEITPNSMEAVFENAGQAINIRFDRSNPDFPIPTFPDPDNAINATAYDTYTLSKLIFEDQAALDQNLIGRLDLEIPYGKKGGNNILKFGTLLRFKDKSRDVHAQSYGAYRERSNLYPIRGDTLTLAAVSDDFYDGDFLDRGYELASMVSPELMRDWYERWPTLFVYGDAGITESLERTYSQDYTADEAVQAYYFMVRHNFNKIMVLGGVRYERTDISYEGFQVFKGSSGFFTELDTVTDDRTVEFWLPNLQFKYQVKPDLNVRAAITTSYARPNFRDVIPYRVQNERTEVRLGNPNLDYPSALNLDFLIEKYWGGRNIISGGIFYKRIDNFIFNYKVFGYEGDPTQANFNRLEIELPLNGRRAFVRGAEVQLQTFFSFLPNNWKNIGVLTNYTYTDSEGILSKRFSANDNINIVRLGDDYSDFFNADATETIPLPGQAPHTLNIALFYDSPKWYFKISANYNDNFLSTLGADPDLDEYYGKQWRVDLNGYYQFTKALQVFGDLRNVTNEPLRYYLGSPENRRILQTEFYSFWVRLGLRIKF